MKDTKLLELALSDDAELSAAERERLDADPAYGALHRDAARLLRAGAAELRVPDRVTGAIFAAAARRNLRRQAARRIFFRYIPVAATLAVMLGAVSILNRAEEPQPRIRNAASEQLISLADWTKLEQESYNLSLELAANQYAVADNPLQQAGDLL